MSNCIKDLYDYNLVKKCSKCGLVKMKTDFYLRNNNQKYRKECAQCTKVKQKEFNSETEKKLKIVENKIEQK